MSLIKNSNDPSDSSNQQCRLGLTNSDSITNQIKSVGSAFIDAYISSMSSSTSSTTSATNSSSSLSLNRRKRSAISLTCSDLNNLSGSLNSLTTTQLSSIISSEFVLCQTLLGSSSNSWSLDQLSTLTTIAKSVSLILFYFNLSNKLKNIKKGLSKYCFN